MKMSFSKCATTMAFVSWEMKTISSIIPGANLFDTRLRCVKQSTGLNMRSITEKWPLCGKRTRKKM
jgi:hypothetical protein